MDIAHRDTDVAEEMMAYTKNNILVQSAQAMLAQANQIPQISPTETFSWL